MQFWEALLVLTRDEIEITDALTRSRERSLNEGDEDRGNKNG